MGKESNPKEKPEVKKNLKQPTSKASAKEVFKLLTARVQKLELNQDRKKSRTTYSNEHRVAALELRKRFVLVHLPKRANLKDLLETKVENGVEVDHIGPFEVTYDSRSWSYIRVSRPEQVNEAIKVITFAKAHN